MVGLLVLLFLVVPVVEIYVIIQVGEQIGALPTVLLLVIEGLLGAWVVKREGRRAWEALRGAVGTGRVPSGELADAALVLVGGTLLLTPGFVTDIAGWLLVLPITRPLPRRILRWFAARRAGAVFFGTSAYNARQRGRVVPGEVIQDRPGRRPTGESGSGPDT